MSVWHSCHTKKRKAETLLGRKARRGEEGAVAVLLWCVEMLGPKGPTKIREVTLMRPIHGNL